MYRAELLQIEAAIEILGRLITNVECNQRLGQLLLSYCSDITIDLPNISFLFAFLPAYFNCLKSVCIWNYSGPYFRAFELNTDQNNSEYAFHAVFVSPRYFNIELTFAIAIMNTIKT